MHTEKIFVLYSILPESPRWLISKGDFTKAEKLLRTIAQVNGKDFDSIAYEQLVNTEKIVNIIFCFYLLKENQFFRERHINQCTNMDVEIYFDRKY